jgi:hypothetical protein
MPSPAVIGIANDIKDVVDIGLGAVEDAITDTVTGVTDPVRVFDNVHAVLVVISQLADDLRNAT